MHKIFKYPVENLKAKMPVDAIVIRTDKVDDTYYNGSFVWAIVDPEQTEVKIFHFEESDFGEPWREPTGERVRDIIHEFGHERGKRLAAAEKQEFFTGLRSVEEVLDDGNGGLYAILSKPDASSGRDWWLGSTTLVFYKTGQEFRYDPSELEYVGFCRIWIKQELGLYGFVVKK